MMVSAKADVTLLATTPRQKPRLAGIAERWPLDTLLAAIQILAETRGKLRGSPHGRTLVEIALVKVARLDDLEELGRRRRPALGPGVWRPSDRRSSKKKS